MLFIKQFLQAVPQGTGETDQNVTPVERIKGKGKGSGFI